MALKTVTALIFAQTLLLEPAKAARGWYRLIELISRCYPQLDLATDAKVIGHVTRRPARGHEVTLRQVLGDEADFRELRWHYRDERRREFVLEASLLVYELTALTVVWRLQGSDEVLPGLEPRVVRLQREQLTPTYLFESPQSTLEEHAIARNESTDPEPIEAEPQDTTTKDDLLQMWVEEHDKNLHLSVENERLRREMQALEEENERLNQTASSLKETLAERERERDSHKRPDRETWWRKPAPEPKAAEEKQVSTVLEAVEEAKRRSTNIIWLESATESARASPFRRPNQVLSALLAIDEYATLWTAQATTGERLDSRTMFLTKQRNLEYVEDISTSSRGRYAHEYTYPYDGKATWFGAHILIGRGNRDECLMIYLHWDVTKRKAVIAHVGAHKSTLTA